MYNNVLNPEQVDFPTTLIIWGLVLEANYLTTREININGKFLFEGKEGLVYIYHMVLWQFLWLGMMNMVLLLLKSLPELIHPVSV